MYIYIYMYIYISKNTCIYIYINITYIHTYVYIYVCLQLHCHAKANCQLLFHHLAISRSAGAAGFVGQLKGVRRVKLKEVAASRTCHLHWM